jgi:hypothetical protein
LSVHRRKVSTPNTRRLNIGVLTTWDVHKRLTYLFIAPAAPCCYRSDSNLHAPNESYVSECAPITVCSISSGSRNCFCVSYPSTNVPQARSVQVDLRRGCSCNPGSSSSRRSRDICLCRAACSHYSHQGDSHGSYERHVAQWRGGHARRLQSLSTLGDTLV